MPWDPVCTLVPPQVRLGSEELPRPDGSDQPSPTKPFLTPCPSFPSPLGLTAPRREC